MKVYIDIFFFVNFLMNLQVFQILNYWRRKPAVSARSIAGAGLGALLGVLVVILGIRTRWILWILVYAVGTSILIRFVYGKMNFPGTSSVCGRILSDRGCRFRNVIWNS